MLNKLLKYEIKATARLFLPLYLALLVFALINRFLSPIKTIEPSNNFNLQILLGFLSMTIYIALIVGTFVMTLVIMIQRFYKNLLGDEGYLMFTLPVKSWKHIVSKLLIAVFWTVLSFLTTICSILIIVNAKNLKGEFFNMVNTFKDFFGYAGFFTIPVYALLWIASNILMIYAAITLGHLFAKHKLIASFGMYCILYVIYQTAAALFILLFKNTIFASLTAGSIPTPLDLNRFISLFGLLAIIFASANFIIANTTLKNKLNLE